MFKAFVKNTVRYSTFSFLNHHPSWYGIYIFITIMFKSIVLVS